MTSHYGLWLVAHWAKILMIDVAATVVVYPAYCALSVARLLERLL